MIKDLERHEDFIDDKELYRQYEKDFYRVEYALSQINNLGLPEVSQFKVDFSEVEYPMTTQDKIMLNEYKLKHNLTTQAQLLAEENKDLSVEDARQIIEANKSINGAEVVNESETTTED
jgi:hypothetical protein